MRSLFSYNNGTALDRLHAAKRLDAERADRGANRHAPEQALGSKRSLGS